MKIKKRLLLLLILTFIGAILFIPFIVANESSTEHYIDYKTPLIFTSISVIVVALTGWGGLIFSDYVNIKMPILRNWEINQKLEVNQVGNIIWYSVLAGLLMAVLILAGNYFVHPPINKGTLVVRIATFVWASVVTETLLHLFLLSGLIYLIKNNFISIIISALTFVIIFHLNSGLSPAMTFYISLANFSAAVLTGYLFVKKGFESAVFAHMVMHFLLLAVNI